MSLTNFVFTLMGQVTLLINYHIGLFLQWHTELPKIQSLESKIPKKVTFM